MKIGTQLGFSDGLQLTEEEVFKHLAEAGFDCVDYPLMLESYDSPLWQLPDIELRNKMESTKNMIHHNGLTVCQTHSPLDGYWWGNISTKEARWHAQIQAIKASAFLGSPYVVVHPLTSTYRVDKQKYEEAKKINMEYYRFLEPYLKEYNVKAAIENLFGYDPYNRACRSICSTASNLKDYIDTLDSDRFVVCLDVGHATLALQDPVEMIYELGKDYLHVTHMHDNCHLSDDHMMPGFGKLDWFAIGKALHDIGYEGVFNFEADRPYYKLGEYTQELSLELLKMYAQLGKAITHCLP